MNDKIRLDYQMFRWGPLLVKFKIPDDIRKKLLEEAEASNKDYEKNLAGVITKEVGFRNIEMFQPFFHAIFEMYADAQLKWAPEVGATRETFKQQYLIEALWANFQGPGDFNPPHDHGGTLSWVIFLQMPKELIEENKKYKGRSAGPGGLTFIYGEGPRSYISHHSFVPEEGDMFIFPASLKHWVFPFKSNCVRISVSGNVNDSIKYKDLKKLKEVKKNEPNNNKEGN